MSSKAANQAHLVGAGFSRQRAHGLTAIGMVLAYLLFSPLLDVLGLPSSFAAVSLMDWQRIFELLTAALVVLLLAPAIIAYGTGGVVATKWQVVGWVAFFALGALSSVMAKIPLLAFLEWSWTLLWFSTTVLLVVSAPSRESLRDILSTWTLAVLASYSMFFYVGNSDALFDPSSVLSMRFPGFNNVRVFADYQTVVLCFAPYAIAYRVTGSLWRALGWVLVGLYAALAIASGSRSLLLGQLIAWATVVFFLRRSAIPFIRGQLWLWLIGGATYGLLFVLLPMIGDSMGHAFSPFLRFDSSRRSELWQIAASVFLSDPMLGIGPGHFAIFPNVIAASPHNQVLQVLAEWGGVAGLIFIMLIVQFTVRRLRSLSQCGGYMPESDAHFAAAATAALMALLVQSLVSPVFNNPASQMMLSLLAVVYVRAIPLPFEQVRLAIGRPVAVVAMVAVVLTAYLVAPWMSRIAERNQCYLSLHDKPTGHFAPRFWQQGWVFAPCDSQ